MSAIGTVAAEIARGLTSGYKLQALMEQTKAAKAERLEFELTKGYRETMRGLNQEKLRGENNLDSIRASILQQELAMMPDKVEGVKAQTGLTQAQIRSTDAQTRTSESQVGENIARGKNWEADAAMKYSELAARVGGNAASLDMTPEDEDALVNQFIESSGIDKTQALKAKAFYGPQIVGGIRQQKAQLDDLRMKNAADRTTKRVGAAQTLADLAGRTMNPEATIDEIGSQFVDDPEVLKIAKTMVKGGLQSKAEQAQEARPLTSAEVKLQETDIEQLASYNRQIADLELKKSEGKKSTGGTLIGGFGSKNIDKQIAGLNAQKAVVVKRLEGLRESLRPSKKETPKSKLKASVDNLGGSIEITSQDDYNKLPKGAKYIYKGTEYIKK